MTVTISRAWVKYLLPVVGLLVFLLAGADGCSSSNDNESNQVSSQQDVYTKNQPVPTYNYSAERQELIDLYNHRVKGDSNTWSVWVGNNGVPLGMCASKGFPIPYGSELTNPQQAVSSGQSGAITSVGQMDPNGLYPASNALGTWVMCLNSDGSLQPFYSEPLVLAYTYPVEIRNGQIVKAGEASGGQIRLKGQ